MKRDSLKEIRNVEIRKLERQEKIEIKFELKGTIVKVFFGLTEDGKMQIKKTWHKSMNKDDAVIESCAICGKSFLLKRFLLCGIDERNNRELEEMLLKHPKIRLKCLLIN